MVVRQKVLLKSHGSSLRRCFAPGMRAALSRLTGGASTPPAAADLNLLPVVPNPSTGVTRLKLTSSAMESQTITIRHIGERVRTEASPNPASADRRRTMLDLRYLLAGVCFLETAGERRCSKLVLARPGGAP